MQEKNYFNSIVSTHLQVCLQGGVNTQKEKDIFKKIVCLYNSFL